MWVCGMTLGIPPHLFNEGPGRLTVEDPLASDTLKQAYMCVEPWLHLGQVVTGVTLFFFFLLLPAQALLGPVSEEEVVQRRRRAG